MSAQVEKAIAKVLETHRTFQRARDKSGDELVHPDEDAPAPVTEAERAAQALCDVVATATSTEPSAHVELLITARTFRQVIRATAGRGRDRTPRRLKGRIRLEAYRTMETGLRHGSGQAN